LEVERAVRAIRNSGAVAEVPEAAPSAGSYLKVAIVSAAGVYSVVFVGSCVG
jgi:hypothetical protein